NQRGDPGRALERLQESVNAPGERQPWYDFEAGATKGRALRQLGRGDDAQAVLDEAAQSRFARTRLGPQVQVDLGHLAAERGDFEAAERHYRDALAIDPS